MLFRDRYEAGTRLADELESFRGSNAIVFALPRGGIEVGFQVARHLGLPLEAIIARKIGAPGNPEYAIGAVAENREVSLNYEEINVYAIPKEYLDAEIDHQLREIEQRIRLYRDGRGLPRLEGRSAIVVDDGIATGFTMAAALKAVRRERPRELVLAIPVAPKETLDRLSALADKAVCLATPEPFLAVGRFYANFQQVDDIEVRRLLDAAKQHERGAGTV